MNININYQERFENRHNNSEETDRAAMLQSIGVETVAQLISETIPDNIRLAHRLNLPEAISEAQFLKDFKVLACKNHCAISNIEKYFGKSGLVHCVYTLSG
jgi:glycine dehydrogenase